MENLIFTGNMNAWIFGTGVVFLGLGYIGAPLFVWTAFITAAMIGFGAPTVLIAGFLGVATVFNIKPIRTLFVSTPIMKIMKALKLIPQISETERTALNAGSVWVDADLFSGKPKFKKLMNHSYPNLTADEKAFLDGPIEELCNMIDDWKIYQNKEIPVDVLNFMRKIKIFGMIVPKEYGGLGFSALAHSEVIMKLSSRSIPVTITAMVPNSLGPAELLIHYGTTEQKDYYLPKLASGEFIPCFALTEQRAGSDAGSLESNGELFKKNDGSMWIRLNWNKRWITLAGISNVLGLAFELRDPDKLIGEDYILGITCALIPSTTKGVVLGNRHDPLGVPFYNCPTQGESVEVPVDHIIGGLKNAGKGWGMLMDCLGAGRGISLPAQSTGGAKLIARICSAHSSIRRQFGLPLYKLEGLEEPLARIGGIAYMLDAMRVYTAGALDNGIKPSVITAIAKLNSTELGRIAVNDGMDIMAGAGISRGPRNMISNIYSAIPIGVTVEGANILTRTMIIFGQGLMRAHPYAYKEVESVENNDAKAFDSAFFGHIGHVFNLVFRSALLSITRGRIANTPGGYAKRYYQKLAWSSASFAILADIAMGTLGGSLKMKEKLTGRFADILSWMYIGTATLRRFQAEGERKEDRAFLDFSLRYAFNEIQIALDGILENLKVPGMGWFFKYVLRSWSKFNQFDFGFDDALGHKVSVAMVTKGDARDRLSQGIFYPKSKTDSLGRLEYSFNVVKAAEEVERKITQGIRKKILPKKRLFKLAEMAKDKGLINEAEFDLLNQAAKARWDACQVDEFTEDGYHGVEDSDNKQFKAAYNGPAGAPENYDYKKSKTDFKKVS